MSFRLVASATGKDVSEIHASSKLAWEKSGATALALPTQRPLVVKLNPDGHEEAGSDSDDPCAKNHAQVCCSPSTKHVAIADNTTYHRQDDQ